ncbi:hypothetical protein K466DRAFT_594114 [Polyporus arcularius HHB13444]|uniref:Uncharacterized protein n=1 Tax=Polyporus arcularius HHB13444 TaxID=1314778 RepID=A0A5C3PYF1_9APHY|nr:hypothetical protein K466DRAFT_594114 [Polyporus arcularius HHB13444]
MRGYRKNVRKAYMEMSSIPFPEIDKEHVAGNPSNSQHDSTISGKHDKPGSYSEEVLTSVPDLESLPEIPDEDEEVRSIPMSPSKLAVHAHNALIFKSHHSNQEHSRTPASLPPTPTDLKDISISARKRSREPGFKLSSLALLRIPRTIYEHAALIVAPLEGAYERPMPLPKGKDAVPRLPKTMRSGEENQQYIGEFGDVHQPPSGAKPRKTRAVSRHFGSDMNAFLNSS